MAPDQWNAVALDGQIRASSSNPIRVHDYAVALWRSASGVVNAWEDRCPHRGMRLSLGFVEGDQLRCIYHGWGYGSDGQCKVIPAHPALTPPKTICANRHAAETRYGLIWTNLAENPQSPIPDLGADADWSEIRSIYLQRPVAAVRKAVATEIAEWGGGTLTDGEIVRLELADGTTIAAAFQPVDAHSSGVHFVARGPGAAHAEGRHALARRIVDLRHRIENS